MENRIRRLLAEEPPAQEAVMEGRRRLQEFMAQETQNRKSRVGRSIRWWVPTGLVAGACAAAVAATVLVSGGAEPAGGGDEVVRLSGAQEILVSAAETVEGQEAGEGSYWYTSQIQGRQVVVGGDAYLVEDRVREEWWRAVEQGETSWRVRERLGGGPVSDEDKAAWSADGEPETWTEDLEDENGEISEGAGAEGVIAAPGAPEALGQRGQIPWALGTESFTEAELADLPTDKDELLALMNRVGEKDADASAPDEWVVFRTTVYMITELPVSPEVRGAAYRMLAELPGVTDEGEAADRLGRTGDVVSLDGGDGFDHRLIVDSDTGLPLAYEMVRNAGEDSWDEVEMAAAEAGLDTGDVLRSVTREGQIISYTAFEESGWTDELPTMPENQEITD